MLRKVNRALHKKEKTTVRLHDGINLEGAYNTRCIFLLGRFSAFNARKNERTVSATERWMGTLALLGYGFGGRMVIEEVQ